MGERIIIRSAQGLLRFCTETLPKLFERGKYLVITYEFGKPASNAQKALLKIWIRKVAAHLLHKRERDVTKDEMERTTRAIKKRYYLETGERFMVAKDPDPMHPDKSKLEVTSSAGWTSDEISRVMNWLQAVASTEHDLILESTGDYEAMQHSNNR